MSPEPSISRGQPGLQQMRFSALSLEGERLAAPYGLQGLNLEPGFVPFQKLFSVTTVPSCAAFPLQAAALRPLIGVFYSAVTGTTAEQ